MCGTGLAVEGCQAVLTSSSSEGVRALAMDVSRDAVFVGDSHGFIHVLRMQLLKGQLQPLVLLARVPPPGCAACRPLPPDPTAIP